MNRENIEHLFSMMTGLNPACCDLYITASMDEVNRLLKEQLKFPQVRLDYLCAGFAKLEWLKNQRVWKSGYLATEIDKAEMLVEAYLDMCSDLIEVQR